MSEIDAYEEMRLYNYELGQAAAYEDLAAEYAQQSGKAFAAGQDAEANVLRGLIPGLKAKAARHRGMMQQQRDVPVEIEAAEVKGGE
jgi:hypothetical protein